MRGTFTMKTFMLNNQKIFTFPLYALEICDVKKFQKHTSNLGNVEYMRFE